MVSFLNIRIVGFCVLLAISCIREAMATVHDLAGGDLIVASGTTASLSGTYVNSGAAQNCES